MASIAVGSSQTFTAGVRDAVFVVVINGGTYATVTGAQSASLGPSPVRRSFGPFAVGESITVAVQSGDAAIVEYGDQTPGEVGGANSWLSGAQTSAGATGVAGVTAGGSLVGPDGSSIGAIGRYTGQIATSTFIPDVVHPSALFGYTRTPHFCMDDVSSVQIVYGNWRAPNSGAAEANGPGTITYTASIEYPAGTFTQATFSGSTSGAVTAGNNLVTDAISVRIPRGAKFWVRTWQSAPGKVMYFQYYGGDGSAQAQYGTTSGAVPDMTMGGTSTTITATGQAYTGPIAIIGLTSRASVAIVGDSISIGRGDSGDESCRQGYIARALGQNAYLHCGTSGDNLTGFLASNTKRRALANYCSHIITNFGINDVTGGVRTAAQIDTDLASVKALWPGKPFAVCTLLPVTTSTDSWVTTANQTVTANETTRIAVNAMRRNGSTSVHALFDAGAAAESAWASGLWQVIPGTITPGSAAWTADGTHPNKTGYLGIAGKLNIGAFLY